MSGEAVRISKWLWLGLLLVVLLAGIGYFLATRPEPAPDGKDEPSPQMVTGWIAAKNRSIALMENSKPGEAEAELSQLSELLPQEPLVFRNLTVARLLQLEQLREQNAAAGDLKPAAEKALETVRRLRGIDKTDTTADHWLAARIYIAAGATDSADAELQAGLKENPQAAALWYELFRLHSESSQPNDLATRRNAIDRLLTLQPDNLLVIVEWSRQRAAEIRTATGDWRAMTPAEREAAAGKTAASFATMPGQLQEISTAVRPFAESIRTFTGADPLELLNFAATNIAQDDWPAVAQNLSRLANLLIREANIDRPRIDRNPLEFVQFDFSEEFRSRYPMSEAPAEPGIAVNLIPFPAEQLAGLPGTDQPGDIRDIAVADLDLDGHLDIVVLRDGLLELVTRDERGRDWKQPVTVEIPAGLTDLRLADLDGDFDEAATALKAAGRQPTASAPCVAADVDLILSGPSGVSIVQNRFDRETGDRRFAVMEMASGLEDLADVSGLTAVDFDHDGDLDLAISSVAGVSLHANRGDGTFTTPARTVPTPLDGFRPETLIPVDWDRDMDIDLIVSDAGSSSSGILENLRHGRFRWRTFEGSLAPLNSAVVKTVLETDGNGSWDILYEKGPQTRLARTRTTHPGVVQLLEVTPVADSAVHTVQTWDHDNDGHRDLLASSEVGLRIFRGLSGGKFDDATNRLSGTPAGPHTFEIGDLDGDGDEDVVIAGSEGVSLLSNDGGNANRWIDVALVAQQVKGEQASASGRVNAHGLGSLLEAKAGRSYQAVVVEKPLTHFGLGKHDRAETVRVLWTNGIPHNVIDPAADQTICEKQTLKGSCPYLYAWDGERFVFVTDLLWASPIGLQHAAGILATPREWEYLKIPGEMLRDHDGEYRLQVTEELWEAAYFDEIRLMAVDHPADVEIFSNEKVGPPAIAEFGIHTVRNRRIPVSVQDGSGRDLLPEVNRQDEIYARPFQQKHRQGLTEDSLIEIDLGPLEDAEQITLFLRGWVYPTDTSVNVALSDNPDLPSPRPPSLWVPDDEEQWKQVRPFMGFPGGKTKTIAVDLSGLFVGGDHRLRISTNMEFAWDQIFFSVDEPEAQLQTIPLKLSAAVLHYRGFSEPIIHPQHGPERYDYHQLTTAVEWPPLEGHFTRYGDVTELLAASDDRLVVMGAGDEMTLRFQTPAEAPPAGWTRDFLIYNVGWDKDADLNTVYGQTVEPLPFIGMDGYPYEPLQSWPDTDFQRDYLRRFQTRSQGTAAFHRRLLSEE